MVNAIFIIVFFLILAALVITRKLPAFIALIVMGVGIALIAGVPLFGQDDDGKAIGVLETVIGSGAMMMSAAMGAVLFGAWLGRMVTATGVSRKLINVAAELGGDRPLIVALCLSAVIALLWTTLAGLGSQIMLGSIAIPILIAVGIPPIMAGSIYILAMVLGWNFNLAQWASFMNIFGCTQDQIRQFATILFFINAVVVIAYILIEFKRKGIRYAFSAPVDAKPEAEVQLVEGEEALIKGWRGVFCCLGPLVPIVLVMLLKMSIIPAFIIGIIWLTSFSAKGSFTKVMSKLVKCAYDGIQDVAPAIFLFVSIGIVYTAVTHPTVKAVLSPMVTAIVPTNLIGYILFFVILAPLALYRGPLNLFGLGSGIAAMLATGNTLPMLAVMGAFVALERIQAAGCPTNTHNVWVCNFIGEDVSLVTWKFLPYIWAMAGVGVIVSAILYL